MKIEKSRFNSEASTQLVASQKEIFKAEESDISVIKFEGYTVRIVNEHTRRKELYTKKASKRGKDLQSCKGEKARLATEEIELWRKYQPDLLEVH